MAERIGAALSDGLPDRNASHWSWDDDRDIVEMDESGWTPLEMADAMGRSVRSVRNRRNKLRAAAKGEMAKHVELPARAGSQWTGDEDRLLLGLHRRRYSDRYIASLLKRTPKAVATRLLGLTRGEAL